MSEAKCLYVQQALPRSATLHLISTQFYGQIVNVSRDWIWLTGSSRLGRSLVIGSSWLMLYFAVASSICLSTTLASFFRSFSFSTFRPLRSLADFATFEPMCPAEGGASPLRCHSYASSAILNKHFNVKMRSLWTHLWTYLSLTQTQMFSGFKSVCIILNVS